MKKRLVRLAVAVGLVSGLALVPEAGAAQGYVDVRVRTCEWMTITDDQVVHACGVASAHAQEGSFYFTAGGGGTASAYIQGDGEVTRDETIVLQTVAGSVRVNGGPWRDRYSGWVPVPGGPIDGGSRPALVRPGDTIEGRLIFRIFLVQPDGSQIQLGDRHYAESDPVTVPPLP